MNLMPHIKSMITTLRPKSSVNTDSIQFDYKFWTELESLAKKEREKSLDVLKEASKNPNTPGVVMQGQLFTTELVVGKMSLFDPELFMDNIIDYYKDSVQKWKLRELAGVSKKEAERKSYKTKENE